MQFRIRKALSNGRFYVHVELSELGDVDLEKLETFGEPTILIKSEDGRDFKAKIRSLGRFSPFGFYEQEEADNYSEMLKSQIAELKNRWENLNDTWSNEEII